MSGAIRRRGGLLRVGADDAKRRGGGDGAEKKKLPSALSTPRRLSEGEVLNILHGTGPAGAGALSRQSRLLALARSEAERHATLRRIALDHLDIATDEDGWEQRYMARLKRRLSRGLGSPSVPAVRSLL